MRCSKVSKCHEYTALVIITQIDPIFQFGPSMLASFPKGQLNLFATSYRLANASRKFSRSSLHYAYIHTCIHMYPIDWAEPCGPTLHQSKGCPLSLVSGKTEVSQASQSHKRAGSSSWWSGQQSYSIFHVWCPFPCCFKDTITAFKGNELALWWPDCIHLISFTILTNTESLASTILRTGLRRISTQY